MRSAGKRANGRAARAVLTNLAIINLLSRNFDLGSFRTCLVFEARLYLKLTTAAPACRSWSHQRLAKLRALNELQL
jgi:hypothetical protein